MKRRDFVFVTLAAPAMAALSGVIGGCGGGGETTSPSSRGRGQFRLTFRWPERSSRLIPVASNSIVVTLTGNDGSVLGTRLIVADDGRLQSSTETLVDLAPGTVTLTATAYPLFDGTGVAQATGAVGAIIRAGETTQVTLTMGSTIDRVEITPANPTVALAESVRLMATPKDAQGNVVLSFGSSFVWTLGNVATASYVGGGDGGSTAGGQAVLATGNVAGTTTLTVVETESGKGDTTTLTVGSGAVTGSLTGPNQSAVDPTGKFLYVADRLSSAVSQFRINADGTLSPLSPATVAVALPPYSIRANPAPGSHTLYVGATDNNNGAIYQFNINADGTLIPLTPATPVSTSQPLVLLIDPAGKFLYDLDHNEGIRPFVINPNGTLTPNGPDVFGVGQLFSGAITRDGKYLYTSGGPMAYRINADGTLTFIEALTSSSGTAEGMSIDSVGQNLYVAFATFGAGGIDSYTVNADGTLTKKPTVVPFSQFAYQCAVSPNGKFLYVVALNSPDNVVAQYAISADGSLSPLSPATVPAGSYTTSVSISPEGKFLYVTNYKDNTISQFRVNDDGTLAPLSPPAVNG